MAKMIKKGAVVSNKSKNKWNNRKL